MAAARKPPTSTRPWLAYRCMAAPRRRRRRAGAMSDARDRVEASRAARERGHPATCECKGTGLIPVSGFTSGYAPCTRVTTEVPPSPEVAALRAEVERLTASYDAACAGWRGAMHERDEARAALAQRETLEATLHREIADQRAGRLAAESECARLRAEGERMREQVGALIAESHGVAGLHRNGEIADWDWLLQDWLSAFAALRAPEAKP